MMCFCESGDNKGWHHVQEHVVASWMFHLYELRQDARRWEVHVAGRQALLRRLLRRTVCQEMWQLLETNYRYYFSGWCHQHPRRHHRHRHYICGSVTMLTGSTGMVHSCPSWLHDRHFMIALKVPISGLWKLYLICSVQWAQKIRPRKYKYEIIVAVFVVVRVFV